MTTSLTGANSGIAASPFDILCALGEGVSLNAQQCFPLSLADKVVVLRDGMLAIDAMPAKGKLQVLDFLMAGDVVSSLKVLSARKVSLRAITRSHAVILHPLDLAPAALPPECWRLLVEQGFNQVARVNLHQMMTGRLETEARVASFLLALALRHAGGAPDDERRPVVVPLPMSRVDIANYLVINCDTLSRTMMKFSDAGMIERVSRHAVVVKDLPALQRKSPIASLLADVVTRLNAERSDVFRSGAGTGPSAPASEREREGKFDRRTRAALSAAQ